ncbi:MAG: ABC transporter substrate-binding protein [Actinomycetota bacterium]|nr:ABC transporter substrate-binding protein [Actinomycetota bacterium]
MSAPGWNVPMDRRQFLLASLSGAGALAFASCAKSATPGNAGPTVRLPQGATGFPSPFAANADIGYNQMSLLYDTLLWKDGTGALLPWLARSFTSSPDHLTYTFVLRDNLKWSDGQPLTADDVVFTFDYYAKQETLSPPVIIQPPQGIAKVRAPTPQSVEITLADPAVTFTEQVAGALPIIPRHVWSSIADPGSADDRKLLVGSGAYQLKSYDGDGGAMLFTARNDYFLGAPYVKRIEENGIDDSAQIAALASGATDSARGVGLRADTLAPFQNSAFGMVTEVGSTTSPLYWNLGKEGPLSDVRFRRACVMAIDRNDLVTRLASGRGAPGNPGFLSPSNPFFAPVRQYDFDVAGANALLDGAGYRMGANGIRQGPNGSALSFELLINSAEAPLSEVLVSSLKRVGVELRPKPVEIGPQLFGNKLIGAYDMAVLFFPGPGPGGPNSDPDILRLLFSSKVAASLESASSYANPALDALAETQRVTFDESARKSVVADMQKIIADDIPMLPLYYPETTILFRKQVLDQWYFTPGQFPSVQDNKQLFITGLKAGSTIRTK